MSQPQSLRLLSKREFAPLFWTQFLGAFNDNFFKNALIILITYHATTVFSLPPAQIVPLAGGIFILPFFLFSGLAGELADKYEKSFLIRLIKLLEIGIMMLALLGFLTTHSEFLMLVLFLMGTHSAFFGPLKYSILPQHLSQPRDLVLGTSLVEGGTFLAILLGTIAGGSLIAIEESGALWVSAGVILTAVIGSATSFFIPLAPAASPKLKIDWSGISPSIQMLKISFQKKRLRLAILGISWFWCFGAALLSLLPTYGKDFLSAPASVVTFFLGLFSVGIAAGSIVMGRLSKGRVFLEGAFIAAILMSFFTVDLYFVGQPQAGFLEISEFWRRSDGLRIAFDLFALSACGGGFILPLYALLQMESDVSSRSRVIAANNWVNALTMVLSAVLLFVLLRLQLRCHQIFGVLSGAQLVISIILFHSFDVLNKSRRSKGK